MEPVVEFISTGSELMSGTTLDTNFRWAAEQLFVTGTVPSYHVAVGDDTRAISDVLSTAAERSDVVVVSGGLGPTEDDLTSKTAAAFFGRDLIFYPEEFRKVESILKSRGRNVLENHRKLACFPEGSEVIPNRTGVAPGFTYRFRNKYFYFLPGVSGEFRNMFSEYVIPDIAEKFGVHSGHSLKILKTIGLGESEVSSRLSDIQLGDVILSYRIYFPEVHIRLLSRGKSGEEAEDKTSQLERIIKKRLGDYVFNEGDYSLEETVGKLLTSKGLTVSTAESCTGGLLASRLTDVSGSSEYFKSGVVTYSNESKTDHIAVPPELIEQHGAVSSEVVQAMASGIRRKSGTDIGIGISGIAGPGGGTPEKPVGTVFIGFESPNTGLSSEKFLFYGSRNEIKLITTSYALNIIRNIILNIV